MADSEWVVGADESGMRLDKYLAAAGRLESRARAFAGLERGKIFLNGHEADVSHAATRLQPGDTVRVWMDRRGRSKGRWVYAQIVDLDIIFELYGLLVVN